MAPRIRIGTMGWNYPEWKGRVYPAGAKPGEFLRRYSERFPLVEAASSYYGMPKADAVASWAEHTPDDFAFALKVPDWIVRKSPSDADVPKALSTFLGRLEPLERAGKLASIVWQHHPSYTREKHAADLEALVELLPPGYRWAVELRHDSWWTDATYDALREAGVALVWSDLGDASRTPPTLTSDTLHVRLVGDRDLEDGPFDAASRDATPTLRHWAARILDEGAAARRIDIVVSKMLEGFAPESVEKLSALLDVPSGVDAPREGSRQTTLL